MFYSKQPKHSSLCEISRASRRKGKNPCELKTRMLDTGGVASGCQCVCTHQRRTTPCLLRTAWWGYEHESTSILVHPRQNELACLGAFFEREVRIPKVVRFGKSPTFLLSDPVQ